MPLPYRPKEKWDVHTHTTLAPDTYETLEKYSHYADFVRVHRKETKPCCAELVNSKGETLRLIQDNAYCPHARLKDCDRHRVTVQVLSPTPMMIPDFVDKGQDALDICRIINDANAAIAASKPKRFQALAAIPIRFPDLAIAEMERVRQSLGMQGIEINSNVNGEDLDSPQFYPIFEAAAEMSMAVFIHPWGGCMNKPRMDRHWRAWLVGMPMETALAFDAMRSGGIHERLPQLRVLYAHGGGAFPYLLGRLEHGAYCRPDLFEGTSSVDPYSTVSQSAIYTDSLVHSPWALQALLSSIGSDRVVMGSDYPYPLGEADPMGKKGIYPGHMIEHLPEPGQDNDEAWAHFPWIKTTEPRPPLPQLTENEKQRILCENAKRWLLNPLN